MNWYLKLQNFEKVQMLHIQGSGIIELFAA